MKNALRLVAVYVALAAMLARAFVPAGWMPNVAANGAPLIICTMDGGVTVDAKGSLQKQQRNGQDSGRAHDICPFAAAAHFAAPTGDVSFAAPSALFASLEPPQPDPLPTGGDIYAPRSTRGPPVPV
jgi:hypothetical protein